MLRLTLDESEKRIAMALARARYANSRKNKLKKTELPKASVLDPDIEGVMSELALCKYLRCLSRSCVRNRYSFCKQWDRQRRCNFR